MQNNPKEKPFFLAQLECDQTQYSTVVVFQVCTARQKGSITDITVDPLYGILVKIPRKKA